MFPKSQKLPPFLLGYLLTTNTEMWYSGRMKRIRLTIDIDPKLHTDFKVICASTNQSIKSVVVQLMEEYTKQYITNLTSNEVNKRAQND